MATAGITKRQTNPGIWYTDSGASDHFSPHKELFESFHELEKSTIIETAEGNAVGTATGKITITVLGENDDEIELQLNNVIYAPNMSSNLFSLMAAYDLGYETRITPGYGLRILHKDTLVAKTVREKGGLFRLMTTKTYAKLAKVTETTTPELDVNTWHRQLVPLSEDNIWKLAKLVEGLKIKVRTQVGVCGACLEGKQYRQPFHKPATRAKEAIELIHSDLCCPINPTTYGGAKYFYHLHR